MPTPRIIARGISRHSISRARCKPLRWRLTTTEPGHISASGGNGSEFADGNDPHYEVRPRGNAVTHEDEMLKLASNQMDYDAVTSIYTHSIGLIKTAVR